MGYRTMSKHGPYQGAQRKEVISAHECLECGHVITDHHRAGTGWHGGEKESDKRRDHCIGNRDTCPCRKFVQPHEFTRHSVRMG
jgi:hypothetical protein